MKRVVSILGFFVLMTAGAAQAQTHEGFWVGFGFGAGSLGIDGGTGRDTGVMGYLKLGGTINERFLLGMESNAWTKDEIEVAPIWWTPNLLRRERSPQCQERDHRMRRSSGVK